ncbi:CYTH domain-containing protein [bacterium]|nr:CYTH domain-containing protein [bacterium]MCP5461733.1 CYTH domain-containing protein [bacterium]
MPREIEHKYLVKNDSWKTNAHGVQYRQGYFACTQPTVRIRVIDNRGILTIKSSEAGISRSEYEYSIPLHDAEEMLKKYCKGILIEKTRYKVDFMEREWTIDVFHGANDGLILAEIELNTEDEHYELPSWIDKEVSDDPRYYNAYLYKYPYTKWRRKM